MENWLPFDIVALVAAHLPPADVVALSTTCSSLRPLVHDKSIWLDVAERVSYSRPLPFAPCSAQRIPLQDLRAACIRAQRVAQKWSQPIVHPQPNPRRIAFEDRRIISYFAFLPGARHLLVFDDQGYLTCWSCDGTRLATFHAGDRAQLTRWKPSDSPEGEQNMQTVEIMLDHPHMDVIPGRSEIVLLTLSEKNAQFRAQNYFTIPPVYLPFSALTQDEIHGMLTIILPDRLGVYMVDATTENAICIDTGLRPSFGQEYSAQSLLSTDHLVLYWETARGAETHAYDMATLRALLAESGVPQDDPRLVAPIPLAPTTSRLMPFKTMVTQQFRDAKDDDGGCDVYPLGIAHMPNASVNPTAEFDLSLNWDWYPIIIPKWPTLREDLKRHRVRSVMTLSRRFGTGAVLVGDLVDFQFGEGDANLPVVPMGPWTFGNGVQDAPTDAPGGGNTTDGVVPFDTTIAEMPPHYLAPVIPAEVPLPTPDATPPSPETPVDALLRAHTPTVDADTPTTPIAEGPMPIPPSPPAWTEPGLNDLPPMVDAPPPFGPDMDPFTPLAMPDFFDGLEPPTILPPPAVTHLPTPEMRTTITHHYFDFTAGAHTLQRTVLANVRLRRLPVGPEGETFIEDMFAGSPVIGYGGRCALWIEDEDVEAEAEMDPDAGQAQEYHVRAAMKLVTFPAYDGGADIRDAGNEGRVCSMVIPDGLDLDKVNCVDLDDAQGIVGIATCEGDLWLIDYS